MKKLLSALLALLIICGAAVPAFAVDETLKATYGPYVVYGTDMQWAWESFSDYRSFREHDEDVPVLYLDELRAVFTYEGKEWMIYLRKGQRGFFLVGAQAVIFTCDSDEYTGPSAGFSSFVCASEEDYLPVDMSVSFSNMQNHAGESFTFSESFSPNYVAGVLYCGQLTEYQSPRTQVNPVYHITMKSATQAASFVGSLTSMGFSVASSKDNLSDDTVFADGKDVYINWYSIDNGPVSSDLVDISIDDYKEEITVDYGSYVCLTCTAENIPSGGSVHWYVDGKDTATGESYEIDKAVSGGRICVKILDSSGNVAAVSRTETLKVNKSFSDIISYYFSIISYVLKTVFNALFGMFSAV